MTVSTVEANSLTPSEHQVQLRRAVIASTIGTAIEWYDFFLYSTVTGLVFAKLFFPHSDPWVGTLEAFAIYAVGCLQIPLVELIASPACNVMMVGMRERLREGIWRQPTA